MYLAEELEKAPPRHTVHSANVVSLLSSSESERRGRLDL